jgi:hypothetical protein
MPDRPTDGGSFPEDRYAHPEAALGGADAVEKTSYVTGQGTEPEARAGDAPSARVPAGGGQRTTWLIIVVLIAAAGLLYLLGVAT